MICAYAEFCSFKRHCGRVFWLSYFPVGGRPSPPSSTVGRRLAKSSEGQDGSIVCTGVLAEAVELRVFKVPFPQYAATLI